MLEGHCLCGGVRYRTGDEPLFEVICCCDHCQRLTGGGHLPAIGVPRSGFTVEGDSRSYTTDTSMGITSHTFCANCGVLLFGSLKNFPLLVMISAGSLERPKRFSPTMAVHTRERCAWDVLPDGLHRWHGRFGDLEAADYERDGPERADA